MTIHLGYVAASSTLYIPFHTFDSNGASITLTGLAVTDIEIYKNGSVTQRSSDAGYTLLDTDGIDFDGVTGIHGFSIDLSDNTDAGFYAAGNFYWVVVSSVTVDTRTVNFVAATFFIGPVAANATQILGTAISTPATAGILDVNLKNIANATVSTTTAQLGVNAVQAGGTAWGSGAITAASIAADAITAAKVADGTIDAATFAAGAITATVIADGAIDAGALAADTITAAKVAADVSTEINAAVLAILGTPAGASMSADIAAIEAQTDDIGAGGAGLTAVPWNAAWDAEVQSEVDDALVAQNLDHLVKSAVDTNFATTVHLDSVIGQLADNGTTATFDRTTDSLEALQAEHDATQSALSTAQTDISAILVDTGTTLDGRIPAALVGGRMDSNVGAISSDATAADNAEAFFDGTGYAGTNNVIPLVTTTTTASNLTTNNDKTGYRLSATGVDDVLDEVVEGSYTMRQFLRLLAASLGGELSGAATTTITIRNASDTKDVVVATVDADGNRSAVTLDLT